MIPRCKFVHDLPCEQVSERLTELEDENDRLRSCLSDDAENARLIMGENAELRKQMERLVTVLRVDCNIDASWDGLRRFWTIQLTESGCLMRDRACKSEAENTKLRAERDEWRSVAVSNQEVIDHMRDARTENNELRKAMDFQALELGCMTDNRDYLHLENAKLRELVECLWFVARYSGVSPDGATGSGLARQMRELGIEVD